MGKDNMTDCVQYVDSGPEEWAALGTHHIGQLEVVTALLMATLFMAMLFMVSMRCLVLDWRAVSASRSCRNDSTYFKVKDKSLACISDVCAQDHRLSSLVYWVQGHPGAKMIEKSVSVSYRAQTIGNAVLSLVSTSRMPRVIASHGSPGRHSPSEVLLSFKSIVTKASTASS